MDIGLVVVASQNVIGIGTVIYFCFFVGVCTNVVRQTDGISRKIGAKIYQELVILRQFCVHFGFCGNTSLRELFNKPLFQRSEVKGITVVSATKYLIGIRTVVHEHVGTTGDGLLTIAGTIDRCLIAIALHDW